jgi:hypothetical protein
MSDTVTPNETPKKTPKDSSKKRMTFEELEAEKKAILEKQKEEKNRLKEIRKAQSEISRSNETSMGMSFWRFVLKHRMEEYDTIIRSKEFDEYIKSPSVRALFGLEKRDAEEAKGESSDKAISNKSNNRDVPPNSSEIETSPQTPQEKSGEKGEPPEGIPIKYLVSGYSDRSSIISLCEKTFGEKSRKTHWDFDKGKSKWWVIDDPNFSLEPLAQWLPSAPEVSSKLETKPQ